MELNPAFHYTCENCGVDNFIKCDSEDQDIPREVIESLPDDVEIEEVSFFELPETVTCMVCNNTINIEE